MSLIIRVPDASPLYDVPEAFLIIYEPGIALEQGDTVYIFEPSKGITGSAYGRAGGVMNLTWTEAASMPKEDWEFPGLRRAVRLSAPIAYNMDEDYRYDLIEGLDDRSRIT